MVALTCVVGHGNVTGIVVNKAKSNTTDLVGESGNDTAIYPKNGDLRFDKVTDGGYRSGSNIDSVRVYHNGTWKTICYDSTDNTTIDFKSICAEQFHTYPDGYSLYPAVCDSNDTNDTIFFSDNCYGPDLSNCTTSSFERNDTCSACVGIECTYKRGIIAICSIGTGGYGHVVGAASLGYFAIGVLFCGVLFCMCCSGCKRRQSVNKQISTAMEDLPPTYDSVFTGDNQDEDLDPPPPSYDAVISVFRKTSTSDEGTSANNRVTDNVAQTTLPPGYGSWM